MRRIHVDIEESDYKSLKKYGHHGLTSYIVRRAIKEYIRFSEEAVSDKRDKGSKSSVGGRTKESESDIGR